MYIGLGCMECGGDCGQCGAEGLGALPPVPPSMFTGLLARLPARAVSTSAPSPVRTTTTTIARQAPVRSPLQQIFGIGAPSLPVSRRLPIATRTPTPIQRTFGISAPSLAPQINVRRVAPILPVLKLPTTTAKPSTAIPVGSATGASGGGSMLPGSSPLIPTPGGVEVGTLPDDSKPGFSLASLTGGMNPILLAAGLALFLYSEHSQKKQRRG